jgi:heme exporter protein C
MIKRIDIGFFTLGLALLIWGHYWGLVLAPPEREMGEVYRIIFVHVPSAWMALLAFTTTLIASLIYLFKGSMKADAAAEASAEVGVFFNVLTLVTGAIWGKPTWGVYWTWDPRLTTAAIMCIAFAGYLALRRFVIEPERRASWSAIVAIIIYADIPLVWFSVKWWNSLHQLQSSPETVSPDMYLPLRVSAFAFLFLMIAFIRGRYHIARVIQRGELSEPPGPAPEPGGVS